MSTDDLTETDKWQLRSLDAPTAFAEECAALARSNPLKLTTPLDDLLMTLMTELWDRNFSQSEIRSAFERAIAAMPRYAAGLERRNQGPY